MRANKWGHRARQGPHRVQGLHRGPPTGRQPSLEEGVRWALRRLAGLCSGHYRVGGVGVGSRYREGPMEAGQLTKWMPFAVEHRAEAGYLPS